VQGAEGALRILKRDGTYVTTFVTNDAPWQQTQSHVQRLDGGRPGEVSAAGGEAAAAAGRSAPLLASGDGGTPIEQTAAGFQSVADGNKTLLLWGGWSSPGAPYFEIGEMIDRGQLVAVVSSRYALQDTAAAYNEAAGGHVLGKIAIDVPQPDLAMVKVWTWHSQYS